MQIKKLYLAFCILFSLLIINLLYKQIIQFGYWARLSQRNIIRIVPQEGARGRIFDRNAKVIADSRVRFDLALIPQELKNKEALFRDLSIILNIPAKTLEQRFKKLYQNPFSPVIIQPFMDKEKAILLEQEKERFPGIAIQTNLSRFYPYQDATAHILGYVSRISQERIAQLKPYGYRAENLVGYSGIEESKETYLKAEPGGVSFEVDNKSRIVRMLGIKAPIKGNDLTLTVDIEIQKISQVALSNYKGAVIIMDYTTGELITLASSPSFNPNIFVLGEDKEKIKDILKDKNKPMFNRAIASEVSPGSCFKIIVALAGLGLNKINLNDSVSCEGSLVIGNQSFNCWSKHGWQNITEALVHSCNVFFYRLGLKLGIPKIAEYAGYFGLGKKTGIDIPYEEDGFIPGISVFSFKKRRQWFSGDILNTSIGQGDVLVTPLQLVRLVAAVANGGKLFTPYIISNDRTVTNDYVEIKLDKNKLNIVREGLKRAVGDESGTAHILAIKDLKISGKTGTAQVENGLSHGWFVGYLEKPTWSVCVFLENVGGSYVACRVLKEILSEIREKNILGQYD